MIDIEHQAIKAKREIELLRDMATYYEPKGSTRDGILEFVDDAETCIAKVLIEIRKGLQK